MAFKFKDLIVAVVPPDRRPGAADSGGCDVTSGGCGGTCDAGSGGTVGSCTSECGGDRVHCGQSDEVLDPIQAYIDPAYLVDLRVLLRFAVAKSRARGLETLESHMQPRTIEEVEMLERHLSAAQNELHVVRNRLRPRATS